MKLSPELKVLKSKLPEIEWKKIKNECLMKGISLEEYFNLEEPKDLKQNHHKKVFGSDILIIGAKDYKGNAQGISPGASSFYNPQKTLNDNLHEILKKELSYQPARSVDPRQMECGQLSGIDLQRAIAMKYIKKYRSADSFLNNLFFKSKKYKLSEKQCEWAIKKGKEFAVIDKEE